MINFRKFVIGLAVAVVGTFGVVGTITAQRYQPVDPPCVADRPCLVDCPYRAPCPMYKAGQKPEMCYHYRYHCWGYYDKHFPRHYRHRYYQQRIPSAVQPQPEVKK